MAPRTTSAEELFDLFLLGLMWLREDKPEVLTRRGSSVFAALRHARVITEGQRKLLARNYQLVAHAMSHSEIIRTNRTLPKRTIEGRVAGSDKFTLMIAMPGGGGLIYPKFFGPEGYVHVITEAGIAHAASVAPKYARLIDHARFSAGWTSFRRQMVDYMNRNPSTIPAESGQSSNRGQANIPEARYSEEDFEW